MFPNTSKPTASILKALLTFGCSRVMFSPVATKLVALRCAQTAGVSAIAVTIRSEKSARLFRSPLTTIAAAGPLPGTLVRFKIQPLVLLLGPGG